MSIVIPDYVEKLVDAGIRVTLEKNEDIGVYFDLNLQSKSHLHLFNKNGDWYVKMRYDEQHMIKSWEDLLYAAKDGMHGRDFINYEWEQLLVHEGVLVVHSTTTKSYS